MKMMKTSYLENYEYHINKIIRKSVRKVYNRSKRVKKLMIYINF